MNHQNPQLSPRDASQGALIEWRRTFIRSGFFFQQDRGIFDFSEENAANRHFLRLILAQLDQQRHFDSYIFEPSSPTVDETAWLGVIEKSHTGSESGSSDVQNMQLQIMDTYMAGIVRWVNAAGFKTYHSCDGHETSEPRLGLTEQNYESLLDFCFRIISDGEWRFKNHRPFKRGSLPNRGASASQPYNRAWLLDVAESFYGHQSPLQELVKAAKQIAHTPTQ